jgi:histidinol-phosphate aminotransferase
MQAYQPGLREEQIRELVSGAEIYKLSSNESPLPPFPEALVAMSEALGRLNEYPEGSSHRLRAALAEHYGVAPEQILVGNGTNELLTLIAEACLEPGDNVVYGWPSFVVYRYSAQLLGAEYREVALGTNGAFDLDALLERIDRRTKIVYICSPNNPTGVCVSATALDDFLRRVPRQVLVVFDAAYDEFVTCGFGGAAVLAAGGATVTPTTAAPAPNAAARGIAIHAAAPPAPAPAAPLAYFDGTRPFVVLKTFSKAYALAGIRVGFGFAPKPLVEAVERVREPFNVNTVAQAAAIASLAGGDELERRCALNAAGRERLEAGFAELGLKFFPSQANFVWVEVPDAEHAFDQLLRRGIIVRPFPAGGGLRVGVGDAAGVNRTLEVFRELFGGSQ